MRRRTGAQKNYILGHFSATICCYYQNAGIYLRGKEYIKDENNRQHCLVYLRRISCGADVADERSNMLRHGRGHTARQAVLQICASVCGSVRQGYKIRRRRAELHCQYFMDNPARLGERSLLRRDGRCLLLHNNRHPARTPVFQIRKARIHAFRLRGG